MKSVNFTSMFVRSGMVILLVSVVMLFLYSPQITPFFYEKKTINILAWPTEIDGEFLNAFEESTGIKVYINYFESNEELFVKLRATRGKGYDLIMASDYGADLMIKEGLLQKIEKDRFLRWSDLYGTLLGNYFDQFNSYTIPYLWDIYGLGVDKTFFGGTSPEPTWGLVFDKNFIKSSVGMLEDRREVILIAAQYLFGSIEALADKEARDKLIHLLRAQKEWVEIYTDMRATHLLASGLVPVVLTISSDVARVMKSRDLIEFILPKEGSFAIIDSFAIPVATKKQDYVYQFLNYLYQPDILQKYADKYGILMASKKVSYESDTYFPYTIPTEQLFSKLGFFRNVVIGDLLNRLWIAVIS